jgi:hypothetical protein
MRRRDAVPTDHGVLGVPVPTLLGARAALWWARVYTRRLDPRTATDRCDELAADVHDQTVAARAAGIAPAPVSRAIATRTLLGVPADLSWRRHQLRAERLAAREGGVMEETRTGSGTRTAAVLAVPVLLWTLYVGIGWTLVSEDGWTDGRWVGPLVIGSAVSAIAGIVLLARGRTDGAYLVALPAVVSTMWFLWAPVVPAVGVLVAVGFVAYGVRARRRPAAVTAPGVTG